MQNSPASDGGEAPTRSDHAEAPAATAAAANDDLIDELARIEDRYKRALADLDNYRKRVARDIERRLDEGTDALVRDWLELVDSVPAYEVAPASGGPAVRAEAGRGEVSVQMVLRRSAEGWRIESARRVS